jgi:hypothetical protein
VATALTNRLVYCNRFLARPKIKNPTSYHKLSFSFLVFQLWEFVPLLYQHELAIRVLFPDVNRRNHIVLSETFEVVDGRKSLSENFIF